MSTTVDHSAIKTGQLLAMAVMTAAWLFDRWEPVAVQAGIFLVTALAFRFGPYTLIYRFLLRPLHLVQPDERVDNTQPHQFGQAVGAVAAALAALLLFLGHAVAGWVLAGVLVALTAVSYFGWCIGCFIYYQLNRLGLRGFFGHEPADRAVVPGARPRRAARQDPSC